MVLCWLGLSARYCTKNTSPGNEIKKELGVLAGLLLEMPEGDDLRDELAKASDKLQKLGRKLPASNNLMLPSLILELYPSAFYCYS